MRRTELDLPNEFYTERTRLSECLAACVLIDPQCAPTREELPRALISDADLAAVLAIVILKKKPVDIAREIIKVCGKQYLLKLLRRLMIEDQDAVFLWNVAWYASQLKAREQLYQKHLCALKQVGEINSTAKLEIIAPFQQ